MDKIFITSEAQLNDLLDKRIRIWRVKEDGDYVIVTPLLLAFPYGTIREYLRDKVLYVHSRDMF